MLIRNVVRAVSKIIQHRKSLNFGYQFQLQKFVYQPSYSFFFNGKSDKEQQQEQIDLLYEKMSECEDEEQETKILQEIVEIREKMEKDSPKKCILLLLDKIELAKLLVDTVEEDEEIIEQVLNEGFAENIHYNNVRLSQYPPMYDQYLKCQLMTSLIPFKFVRQYEKVEVEVIKNWLSTYVTSINFIHDFMVLNFDRLGEEEGFTDMLEVNGQFLYNFAFYFEMYGKFFHDEGQIQKAIKYFEAALGQTQKLMQIARELQEKDGDAAEEGKKLKEKAIAKIAEIFQQLGLIQVALNEIEAARPYFEKALEYFLQVYGKHSDQYASCYCALANTYQFTDIQKAEEMLKDYSEYLVDCPFEEITLEVNMNLFVILEMQQKGEEKLLISIINLRSKLEYEEDELLILEFNIQAVRYLNRMNGETEDAQVLQPYDWIDEAIDFIDNIEDTKIKANKLFDVVDLIQDFPKEDLDDDVEEFLYKKIYDQFTYGEIEVDDELIQYKIDRQKAFLQFRLRKTLILNSEESLNFFFIFFSNWIRISKSVEQLLNDSDEMIQQILDNKMLKLAHFALQKMIKLMEKHRRTYPELIDEALEHYREQSKNIQYQIIGK